MAVEKVVQLFSLISILSIFAFVLFNSLSKYKLVSLKDSFIQSQYFLFRKKNIPFSQIINIAMATLPHQNGHLYLTLKFTLYDKSILVLNNTLEPGLTFMPYKESTVSKDYDDTTCLPSTEKIRYIISQNPNIQLDKFINSYLETNNTNLYYEYLKEVEANL